jgi:hypothetical protein
MAAKNEQKEVKIDVRLPDSGFPKCMFFNRFRVQRDRDFLLLHFGLDSNTEGILDHYTCLISHDALEQNKNSVIEYLSRSPRAKEKPPVWNKSLPVDRVDAFDIISMSYYKGVAETVLSLYPLTVASRIANEGAAEQTTKAQPLVLLRSTTETQLQLIVALYEE